MANLNRKKVAIIATDGVEAVELIEPKKALEHAGVMVHVISLKTGQIRGVNQGDPGPAIKIDKAWPSLKTDISNAGG